MHYQYQVPHELKNMRSYFSQTHPVSVAVVVVVNFFTLLTSSPTPLHGFVSNCGYMFLRSTPTKFVWRGFSPN